MARILIVDDSPADLKLMESILTSAQHQVSALTDPNAVEARVEAERPDVVLLDVVMPDRNGYEVLRGLKRNTATKDLPVVLVSSKNAETDVRWGLRQGAVDYVTKPYTSEQVLAAVRKAIG